MSKLKSAGGPAFPYNGKELSNIGDGCLGVMVDAAYPGMTLRDYFAAKAMAVQLQVICDKDMDYSDDMQHTPGWSDAFALEVSLEAYTFADAMLRAREQ